MKKTLLGLLAGIALFIGCGSENKLAKINELQAAGNLPDELTWDEFEQQFAVFQANYAAMQTYVPRPFTQPVQLIVSKNSAKGQKDKWLGWQDCLENVSVDVLRGNHFTLLQDAKTIKQIAQTVVGQLTQPVGTRQ